MGGALVVDIDERIGHRDPCDGVVVVVEHGDRDGSYSGGDEPILERMASLSHGLELGAQLGRGCRTAAVPLHEAGAVGKEGSDLRGGKLGEHCQAGCREGCGETDADVGDEQWSTG